MAEQTTVLLTGATGLVGRFLLAGLMRRQVPTLVLVRSQAHRSAVARVDEALAPFETYTRLARPVVIEADLTAPGLGLDSVSSALLRSRPLRVLHSAASIRFVAESPDGEPYATNVRGTQNLLDAARHWQVEQFHHVSTAYVQCDRAPHKSAIERRAFEVPVLSVEQAGNDYEHSKILSERSVQQCPHLGPVTVYRPSIVVGHSQTGYTSTYHGFYAPLQIALGLVRSFGLSKPAADEMRSRLGLRPTDSKNLVPVDWLAEAILHLMSTPHALGNIFHLTHPQPASLVDMQQAIIDALAENTPGSTEQTGAWQSHRELFREQMSVYDSYFQDDPPFDRSHSEMFLESLPCPAMDYVALKRLATAALQSNFGWPKPPPPQRPSRQLVLPANSHGGEARPKAGLRDVQLELQLLGTVESLALPARTLGFYRRDSVWCVNSVLSSSTTACAWRLVVTEQSLLTALSERRAPEEMLRSGQWYARGVLPEDWLDIVRDCLEHVSISDVQNAR